MFLITTEDEKRWKFDRKIIFLGIWCLTKIKKQKLNNLDYEVIDHHWIDVNLMEKDLRKVNKFYDELLEILTKKLNQKHSLNWSTRQWRILIGPWLFKFIQISLDRWKSIKKVEENYEISGTIIDDLNPSCLYTNSYSNLSKKAKELTWNKNFYDLIIKISTNIPYEIDQKNELDHLKNEITPRRNNFTNPLRKIKKFVKYKLLIKLIKLIKRNDNIAIVDSYIPIKKIIKIKAYFNNSLIPDYTYKSINFEDDIDLEYRKSLLSDVQTTNEFERFCLHIIPYALPSIYLENLKKLKYLISKSALPRNPKIILTAISIWHNEVFKIWASILIGKNANLFILQHGGSYGMGKFSHFEDHEKEISDKYLVWGWGKPNSSFKNIPVHIINERFFEKWSKDGGIAIIINHINLFDMRYLTQMHPANNCCDNWLSYTKKIEDLIQKMVKEIQSPLSVRLYPGEEMKNINISRLINKNKIKILKSKKIHDDLIKEKLIICSYAGTTFIECMALNRPCVLLLDPKLDAFRESTFGYISTLIDVKICHETIEGLCNHIKAIEFDIGKWWNSNEVKIAKENFCEFMAKNKGSINEDLKSLISEYLN